MIAARKLKKCKVCPEQFEPMNSLQKACSPKCALSLVKQDRERQERKELSIRKRQLKSRADWLKAAQAAFNAWVRARDSERPCVCCGQFSTNSPLHGGDWDAGHYRSVGSCPALRFEPMNVHRQLKKCNQFMSGRAVDYRIGLIKRIGLANVEWLEGPHPPKKYTIEELIQIRDFYRNKLKEWEKERL